jgi:hypothetical protein
VFLFSRTCLNVDGDDVYDYNLTLWARNRNDRAWWHDGRFNVSLYVYSLSSFQRHGIPAQPSTAGIDFFRHLFQSLPVCFFQQIQMEWKRVDFPPSLCVAFLSIIRPTTAPGPWQQRPPSHQQARCPETTLAFIPLLNSEQREAVFSPCCNVLSNENIRVIFENGYRLDKTGCPVLNTALAGCEAIRHVAIRPRTLVLSDGEIPFTANSNIESLLIRMWDEVCNPRQFLEGVKQNPAIKQLYLEYSGWSSSLAERI